MLYLPPQYAHDGVALGECMTYSIGFKAPESKTLVKEVLVRYLDRLSEDESLSPVLYSDPQQKATQEPGLIPATLQNFALKHMEKMLSNRDEFMRSLGEYLSEPKDHVWFESSLEQDGAKRLFGWMQGASHQALCVSSKTELLYDQSTIFINAESIGATGLEGDILRKLANQRFIVPTDLEKLAKKSEARLNALMDLLSEWLDCGWIMLQTD